MSATGADLLRLLAGSASPQVRPGGAPPAGSAGGTDFASLLQQASAGQIATGRGVTIGKSSGVALSPEQLARVASAADKALAQGASKALVMIDGKALKLDVMTREIVGQVDLNGGGVLTDIDAVVGVPPVPGAGTASGAGAPEAHGAAPGAGVLPLPNPGVATANPSLLRTLASMAGVSN
jgi:hypothetical protein